MIDAELDDDAGDAMDAANFEDALSHVCDDLRSRVQDLLASPEREAVLGLFDALLEDLGYLIFMGVLHEDDAVACLDFLWRAGVKLSWTDGGMLIAFPPPQESILCEGSGRLTARALATVMSRAGRPWRAPESYPGKTG